MREKLISQIKSNNNFEYNMAMTIYRQKKESLRNNLIASLSQHSSLSEEAAIQKVADTIINKMIVNSKDAQESAVKNAKQYFDNIQVRLGSYFNKENVSFAQGFTQAINDAAAAKKTTSDDPTTYTKLFVNRLETQMKKNIDLQQAYEDALKSAGYVADLTGIKKKNKLIAAQRNSYIKRLVIQKIAEELTGSGMSGGLLGADFNLNKNAYIQAVKGEYYERGITDILQKQIIPELKSAGYSGNRAQTFIVQSGSLKDNQGKSIKEDILLNLSLGTNMVTIERNLSKMKSTTVEVDDQEIKELSDNAIKSFFGAQVKSFTLHKKPLKSTRWLTIGGAQKLYDQFSKDALLQYGLPGSIAFLGRAKNIVEALGENNILFATGDGTQWTYDFIQSFRDVHFYLSFEQYKLSGGQALAFKKEVGLYNYAAAKSHLEDYLPLKV